MPKLITLDNLQKLKDKLDTTYSNISHTHSSSDIENLEVFPEGGSVGDVLKKTASGTEWGQAASPIVFNTEYNEDTNKAATMADINEVIGDIDTLLTQLGV